VKLLVVRHAVAMEKSEFVGDDDLRPLTLDRIRKMRKNMRGLERLVDRPTRLVTSPLTRARQTAEILQERWSGLDLLSCESLRPGSKPQALATWLNERIDAPDELVVITGHEPHLSSVIQWMTGARAELKKGGACFIEFDDRIEKDRGLLKWLATPRLLRL
jgi:phosphohistidine phosphatase